TGRGGAGAFTRPLLRDGGGQLAGHLGLFGRQLAGTLSGLGREQGRLCFRGAVPRLLLMEYAEAGAQQDLVCVQLVDRGGRVADHDLFVGALGGDRIGVGGEELGQPVRYSRVDVGGQRLAQEVSVIDGHPPGIRRHLLLRGDDGGLVLGDTSDRHLVLLGHPVDAQLRLDQLRAQGGRLSLEAGDGRGAGGGRRERQRQGGGTGQKDEEARRHGALEAKGNR